MFMAPNDGFVNVQQGFIESSNVDVAEELVGMIVAQRAFELTSKVVTTADEMLQTVSGLKR
jgi:flagellar basal-body rod protein FlgG